MKSRQRIGLHKRSRPSCRLMYYYERRSHLSPFSAGQRERTNDSLPMPILLECYLNINRYKKEICLFNEEIPCPCCHRKLRKHGQYERDVIFRNKSYTIPILRRRCTRCNKTFALIPCFIIPWGRFANPVRELLCRWLFKGISFTHLLNRLCTNGIPILSSRTLYRWKAKFLDRWDTWFHEQRTLFAKEFEGGDGVLVLYREGMNAEQERETLLTFFLGKWLPRKGAVLSKMNLRLPPSLRW